MTEHLQRNPTNEKGKGRPLPARETTLTNLTTVKLSRKRCPKISGRTCVESMLCKVHPELYIPALTQPIMNAPNLYHFTRLGVLCWFEVERSRIVACWADLIWLSGVAVVVWSDGLILVWSDDGLVWELVVGSETRLFVWWDGLIRSGSYGLQMWSGCMA